MSKPSIHLIFVVDPMCSWCWGFHPIIETLRQKYSKQYTYSIVLGGLRASGQMLWNQESRNYLKKNWYAVQHITKQTFHPHLLNRSHFDYNTYPACKAVVTVRELWGEDAAFAYYSRIQSAFYTKGIDISSIEILSSYALKNSQDFTAFYQSERAELLMQHDFSKARSMGANAFPSTVKIDTDGHMVCINGYKSLEEILKI